MLTAYPISTSYFQVEIYVALMPWLPLNVTRKTGMEVGQVGIDIRSEETAPLEQKVEVPVKSTIQKKVCSLLQSRLFGHLLIAGSAAVVSWSIMTIAKPVTETAEEIHALNRLLENRVTDLAYRVGNLTEVLEGRFWG